MTAAVIPSTALAPHPSVTARHAEDQTLVRAAGRRPRHAPYLAPVPDCEPPFDDDLRGPHPTMSRHCAARANDLHPDDAYSRPSDTGAPSADATPLANPAPLSGSGPYSGPGPYNSEVRLHPTPLGDVRPRRAPRPSPAPGPNHGQRADVLLLERSRTAKPTTIMGRGVPPWSSEADICVRKTASEHLPPAQRAGSVLARALVEVLSGQRPLAQLRVHCAPEIYAGLGDRPIASQLGLPHLLTVRVCEPADGVAEVSVAFRRADRVKALAFRIEGVDGRWRITALQLG